MLTLYHKISKMFPGIKLKLIQAEIPDTPEMFIKKTLVSSVMLSTALVPLFLGGLLKAFNKSLLIIVFVYPVTCILLFFYLMNMPDVKIKKIQKAIAQEIVFATRFMIIELESGVPVYNSIVNVSKNYEAVGKYFRQIVEKVNLGTSLEDALGESVEIVPSDDVRKLMWQILNSIKTGADVSLALNAVLDQIVKEQRITVEEYGRKLNPMAMFYMIIAVIVPSLFTILGIIMATFMGIKMNLIVLLTGASLLIFMQFMFYAMIKSSRPAF